MQVSDLERLYDYAYWANSRLLAVVGRLSPEEFTRIIGGSYGSIRNTLVHTLSAEWGWLERCGGPARGPRLKAEDYPTADSVITVWTKVERLVRQYLATLSDQDLTHDVEFSLGPGATHIIPRGYLLQHAANHGVHHRGQVALMLRMLGHAPGDFDILYYDDEKLATERT
ncbi:MAG TPA: DinB family protein [Gemmatimonadaceae bacterium]|nr:DinB family protein [Gemmatimonadaceae bacterium]